MIFRSLLCVLVCTSLVNPTFADDLTEGEFRRLHALLRPDPDEPWRRVPWKISLLDAQKAAAKQQKPIFIWAMDGHPLGCT